MSTTKNEIWEPCGSPSKLPPGRSGYGHLGSMSGRYRPTSLDELRAIVAAAPRIRVLGTGHSFSAIGESDELVSLAGLPPDVQVDGDTVSFGGAMTYGELALVLDEHGLALHNLASLPHISVAGAVATATHGSGDGNGNLATAVAGLELVTSTGDVIRAARGDPDFDGMVVGLGALGAVTRIALDVEPAYAVGQRAYDDLPWAALEERFDELFGSGYSVSVFTRWGASNDQVWVKSRVTDEPESVRDDLFGAVAATADRHPILELDADPCTPQLGRAGSWSDRLPHFRMGFTPSSGEELQSEYLLPRRHATEAIQAVRSLAGGIQPILLVSEIRTVAADGLWMSPSHNRDSVCIHFTWRPVRAAVERMLVEIEAALAPFEARPHWGKLFDADAASIAPLYERRPDFIGLAERLDPRGAFRNTWLTTNVLGES